MHSLPGEGHKERIPSKLHTVSVEPDARLKLTKCEIMTWAKIKSRMVKLLSHPGVRPQVTSYRGWEHPCLRDQGWDQDCFHVRA